MSKAGTTIAWTDRTWNPTVGCSRVSEGCDNCYAMGIAHRGMAATHQGLTILTEHGVDWNGEINLVEKRLDEPTRWRDPAMVFVDSMSDLFHPGVPLDYLARVWDVMVRTPQHRYQILTKRPQRIARTLGPEGIDFYAAEGPVPCPQPNIWLGSSIESDRWTFRTDHLRASPAAIRFVSAEPLLGPLPSLDLTDIDWLIVGGESGRGARPFDLGWARELRDQCAEAGTAFFMKQLGSVAAKQMRLVDKKGEMLGEFPPDLRIRDYPEQPEPEAPQGTLV